ncbi:hypothetical protein BURPS1710b_0257 [Burkholderia pseudomallei 1710b]|uniref:Uncharacterized protein n=1 Tax=Burkholderia pseudomallei (strain 1710b) TaxID=320372 RepID=Q3JXN1_BURP1|nr:hypothetical protein BURPS1710b_0257 [Burkholderia pseudomallei 1710b]
MPPARARLLRPALQLFRCFAKPCRAAARRARLIQPKNARHPVLIPRFAWPARKRREGLRPLRWRGRSTRIAQRLRSRRCVLRKNGGQHDIGGDDLETTIPGTFHRDGRLRGAASARAVERPALRAHRPERSDLSLAREREGRSRDRHGARRRAVVQRQPLGAEGRGGHRRRHEGDLPARKRIHGSRRQHGGPGPDLRPRCVGRRRKRHVRQAHRGLPEHDRARRGGDLRRPLRLGEAHDRGRRLDEREQLQADDLLRGRCDGHALQQRPRVEEAVRQRHLRERGLRVQQFDELRAELDLSGRARLQRRPVQRVGLLQPREPRGLREQVVLGRRQLHVRHLPRERRLLPLPGRSGRARPAPGQRVDGVVQGRAEGRARLRARLSADARAQRRVQQRRQRAEREHRRLQPHVGRRQRLQGNAVRLGVLPPVEAHRAVPRRRLHAPARRLYGRVHARRDQSARADDRHPHAVLIRRAGRPADASAVPPFALPAPPACSVFPAFFAAPARSPARRGVRRPGSCRAFCLPRPFVDEPRGTPSNSAAP